MSRCKPCWLGRLVCNAAEAFAAPEVQWGQLRAVEAHTSPPQVARCEAQAALEAQRETRGELA